MREEFGMEKNPGIKEKDTKKTGIMDIIRMIPPLIESIFNRKPDEITSLSAEDGGWKVNVEMLERKAVPDTQDILGTYELKFKGDGELIGYKRITMRKRGDRVSEASE
jgi:hypothetical protein